MHPVRAIQEEAGDLFHRFPVHHRFCSLAANLHLQGQVRLVRAKFRPPGGEHFPAKGFYGHYIVRVRHDFEGAPRGDDVVLRPARDLAQADVSPRVQAGNEPSRQLVGISMLLVDLRPGMPPLQAADLQVDFDAVGTFPHKRHVHRKVEAARAPGQQHALLVRVEV